MHSGMLIAHCRYDKVCHIFISQEISISEGSRLRETVDQIEKKVVEVIANLLHLDESKIEPDSLLVEDLGMDSFSAVEMLFQFEDQYGLEISDEEMVNLKKVKDVVAYLDDIIPKN